LEADQGRVKEKWGQLTDDDLDVIGFFRAILQRFLPVISVKDDQTKKRLRISS
jgi:hypothetical protein